MKQFLFIILCPALMFSQTQIGDNINGTAADDQFGSSVSLSSDGSIMAIGAPYNNGNGSNSGQVQIYENIGGIWTQIGDDINGEYAEDFSGWSVSLSSNGNIVAIGAHKNNRSGAYSGHVRVYENISGVWTQIGEDIDGEAYRDESGYNISLSSDGSIVAIGAPNNDGNGSDSGHVRVYENISDVWTQVGDDINGAAAGDVFGWSVSLSSNGNIVAIGSPRNSDNGNRSGHVRVYENVSDAWTQIGSDIGGESELDESGIDVSLSSDGSIIAIGAHKNSGNGYRSGHVRVYENISGVWTQIGSDIDGENVEDQSGRNVSLSSDGNIVAIGAIYNDGSGSESGHVRIYKNLANAWVQIGNDIDAELNFSWLGFSVSLRSDGSIVGVGASRIDGGNGNNSGQVRIYDLSTVLLSDSFVLEAFDIYPNPTQHAIRINLKDEYLLKKVNLYNYLGSFIKSTTKSTLDVSKESSGIYLLEVVTDKGKATKKIVVE